MIAHEHLSPFGYQIKFKPLWILDQIIEVISAHQLAKQQHCTHVFMPIIAERQDALQGGFLHIQTQEIQKNTNDGSSKAMPA
jgi:hypothetical protein